MYEEKRKKFEDLYLQDYQNRLRQAEKQKEEFEKMRRQLILQ